LSIATITTQRTAELVSPPLTCVNFPSSTLGSQAARALIRQLEDRSAGRVPRVEQILFPTSLTVRSSTLPKA
jgi:DNA-binding LacI/PurR family transcriptional regulator